MKEPRKMSFRNNLQYLRASQNMTQEQLAMLLGVSRQSISKWESGNTYPEMDKLIMMCEIFDVPLDMLVMGDVTQPAAGRASDTSARSTMVDGLTGSFGESRYTSAGTTASDAEPSTSLHAKPMMDYQKSGAPAQDVVGYDSALRRFQSHVAIGVFAIIFAVGIGQFFDVSNPLFPAALPNDFLMFLCIAIGVCVGCAFIIPTTLGYESFRRRHPYVQDFYTEDDHADARRTLAVCVVSGIIAIMLGVGCMMYCDEALHIDDGWPCAVMLMLIAVGTFGFVYGGLGMKRVDIATYNQTNEAEFDSKGSSYLDMVNKYDTINSAICGTVMILATIVGLSLMFGWPFGSSGYFWMSWVVGGLLCGISSVIFEAVKSIRR